MNHESRKLSLRLAETIGTHKFVASQQLFSPFNIENKKFKNWIEWRSASL